jgi:hypothetical protein
MSGAWSLPERHAHPVAGLTHAALDAHIAGDRRAVTDHLLQVRQSYGEAGMYLTAVTLGHSLTRQAVNAEKHGNPEAPGGFPDTLDAWRFAMAVQRDDSQTALAIWKRFVREKRPGSLLSALVHCYARRDGQGRRPDTRKL